MLDTKFFDKHFGHFILLCTFIAVIYGGFVFVKETIKIRYPKLYQNWFVQHSPASSKIAANLLNDLNTWPLNEISGTGLYFFQCKIIEFREVNRKVTSKITSVYDAECAYIDANNQIQSIISPLALNIKDNSFDKIATLIYGHLPRINNFMKLNSNIAATFIEGDDLTLYDDILISIGLPGSGKEIKPADFLNSYSPLTQKELDEFIQTGNPAVLNNLLPLDISQNNTAK